MRLWSLHPSLLDRQGLLAVWREGLLAQKVLMGETRGYRFHPQLERFRATKNPSGAIGGYLSAIAEEAENRGYEFDVSKIRKRRSAITIAVTTEQLEYEKRHLMRKLRKRDPARARTLGSAAPEAHPMLRVVEGKIEPWEIVRGGRR